MYVYTNSNMLHNDLCKCTKKNFFCSHFAIAKEIQSRIQNKMATVQFVMALLPDNFKNKNNMKVSFHTFDKIKINVLVLYFGILIKLNHVLKKTKNKKKKKKKTTHTHS